MAFNFPNSPGIGQVSGEHTWDGEKWVLIGGGDGGGTPSDSVPLMDGVGAAGVSVLYSRGDHVHPSDTSKIGEAPLDGQAYSRKSATWAVASGTPSNANPVMDGVAVPGTSALYSRSDHVHPSDTTRQAADADLTAIAALTGTGVARRTATTPTWTVGDPIVNSDLATMPIYTLKGNATSSLASPTDIDIAALTLKASPAGGDFLILSDQAASGALKKVGISNLPGASAGISDAPNDGIQYGRQSLGWTAVSGGGASPSNTLPTMDGTAAAGTATLYSRGDHVHPTDTTRAPLASPTFTGVPAALTAASGTNTTQLATTAFVSTAVAGITVVPPSNTNPIIDGTAAPGVLTTYSRGDHVHPMDAELLALATVTSAVDQVPMFTGSGTATTITVTTAARTVLDDTTVGAMLTTLGGQPADAELTALAGVTSAANQVPMFTGSGTATTITVTAFVQTFLDDTTAVAAQTTLGLREKLTADRTYYVRTDGSDSNNGLANTSGGAFLTIQAAYNAACSKLDFGGFNVFIQLADGTYGVGLIANAAWTGGGTMSIQGNAATPINVLVSMAANCFENSAVLPGALTIRDMKLISTGGSCIMHQGAGTLWFSNIRFGASAVHMTAKAAAATIVAIGDYSIDGGAAIHWQPAVGGVISCTGKTITLTGTPAFSYGFASADTLAIAFCHSCTFIGAATGTRYVVASNSIIQTLGASATYLPGNAAGLALTGGLYL